MSYIRRRRDPVIVASPFGVVACEMWSSHVDPQWGYMPNSPLAHRLLKPDYGWYMSVNSEISGHNLPEYAR